MKKLLTSCLSIGLIAVFAITLSISLSSCGGNDSSKEQKTNTELNLITREEGSGTRGAFTELFGLEETKGDKKVDTTSDEAAVASSTAEVLSKVSVNPDAIGYISLGSLNSSVKAVKIDGVDANVENIRSNGYKIHRPFNIVQSTKTAVSPVAIDFINYINSKEGQELVEKNGYIPNETPVSYTSTHAAGSVSISGSSSVSPLMEKLIEAYRAVNPEASVSLNTSDSTTGINDVIEGRSEIGMASRELKDSEISKGAEAKILATDGLAVIVNKSSTLTDLTKENVKNIFQGKKDWK